MEDVVRQQFPKLDGTETNIINNCLSEIIKLITVKFNIDVNKLTKQDMIGLLNLLLPYIDEEKKSRKEITSLNNVYLDKVGNKYVYSNIQYNRCNRDNTYNNKNNRPKEIHFDKSHLEHNCKLLKDTICAVSHKLYVNWINVVPVLFHSVTDIESYAKSVVSYEPLNVLLTSVNNINNITDINVYEQTTNGLHLGDVYNCISKYLYDDVKHIKWLLYDVIDKNGVVKQYLHLLQDLFNLNLELTLEWQQLDKDSKEAFENKWYNTVNNSSQISMISTQFNRSDCEKFLITIAKFFDSVHSKNKTVLDSGYVQIRGYTFNLDVEDDDVESYRTVSKSKVFKSLRSIQSEHMYRYVFDCVNQLKNSWYGYCILNMNKNMIDQEKEISLKNLYNLAKYLTTFTDDTGTFKELPRLWRALTSDQKLKLLQKLTGSYNEFNINNNLRNLYSGATESRNINYQMQLKRDHFKKYLLFYVYNCLTFNGVLSSFVQDVVSIKDIDQYTDAHYFLTNSKYDVKYIKSLKINCNSWCSIYAMNWVSQISFFHRYCNNRVFYVTGSTGVGKSSQIPKLLMYALKAIDYSSRGQIICSQPRIQPTKENAITISKQMGVPILEYNNVVKKEVPTQNYNIMYQYSKHKHVMNTGKLGLKIVTDGVLLQEVKTDPLLNSYNVVIVDEAHEHNKNMDLILTLMRNSLYCNPSVKLVIVSATMNDDEPVYRRYFRDINDNQIQPLNYNVIENKLDRINVDRRLHISPPGETTRFEIKEQVVITDNEDDVVLKIASDRSGLGGDILLFRPGQLEISKSVKYLNEKLPPEFIALPYYGTMTRRSDIERISEETKKLIVQPRDVPYDKDVDENSLKKVPEGTYKRVVIVATNIAEASITISSLRYVVDTGTEKVAKFDYRTRDSSISLTPISESSRVQRKGRVGRVAPGSVYYTYNKDSIFNVKKPFNISTSDLSTDFFSLLKDNDDNTVLMPINSNIDAIYAVYEGDNTQYDYHNKVAPPIQFTTGFDLDVITDYTGSFYIVHPEELEIQRDILGRIVSKISINSVNTEIEVDETNMVITHSNKVQTFWNILQENMLIFNSKKTQFGERLIELSRQFIEEDLQTLLSFVYSTKYDVLNNAIIITSLCKASNYSPNSLAYSYMSEDRKRKSSINELKRYYGSTSDLISYNKIGTTVLNRVDNVHNITSLNKNSDLIDTVKKVKYLYIKKINTVLNRTEKMFYIKILQLDNEHKLVRSTDMLNDEILEFFKGDDNAIKDILDIWFEDNKDSFKLWCKTNHFNDNPMKQFVKTYYELSIKLKNYDFDKISHLIKHTAKTQDLNENVVRTFIHSHGSNLLRYVYDNSYAQVISPTIDSIFELPKINPKINVLDTLVFTPTKYIICLQKDSAKHTVKIVTGVDVHTVQKLVPFLYAKDRFEYNVYPTTIYKKMANTVSQNKVYIEFYEKMLRNIITEMSDSYDPTLYQRLPVNLDVHSGVDQAGGNVHNITGLVKRVTPYMKLMWRKNII